jgi:glutathione synthase
MNISDERPLEYALWDHEPQIPAYCVLFGEEVLACTPLNQSRELLYQPPSGSPPIEVSVAYLRAGYDPNEYTPTGYGCCLLLERSRAIKCPSILGYLATFKKVQ